MIYDDVFLKELDQWPHREVFAKIVSLSWDESPREEIEGYITGGSINVDGSSAMRRTCSLTMVTQNTDMNALYWALETKFQVFIGLKNMVDDRYDDIIWFPQGIYIITSYSQTLNTSGYTIQIQGKDKMCLLDGSIGGNIPADHDFGKIDTITYDADGNAIVETEDILIYDIVREAVHVYAREPYEKIIINDLEDCSVMLMAYKAKNVKLFIYNDYKHIGAPEYVTNMIFEGYSQLADELAKHLDGQGFEYNGRYYELVKEVRFNDTAGYQLTDLTYAGDLICSAGSSITSMLDKVAGMLGEFEYFYDLDGKFVFQRKKIYANITWTNEMKTADSEIYYDSLANSSANMYEFTSGQLVESFSNKPQVNMIKNDFTIWGERVSSSGVTIPLHMRYAIDVKPQEYFSLIDGVKYIAMTEEQNQITHFYPIFPKGTGPSLTYEIIQNNEKVRKKKEWYDNDINNKYTKGKHPVVTFESEPWKNFDETAIYTDWRELIYRMAKDYMKRDSLLKEVEKYDLFIQSLPEGQTVSDYITKLNALIVLCDKYAETITSDNKIRVDENGVALPSWIVTLTDTAVYKTEKVAERDWLQSMPTKKENYVTWEKQDISNYTTYFYDMLEYWPRVYSLGEYGQWIDGDTDLYFVGWHPDYFSVAEKEMKQPDDSTYIYYYLFMNQPEAIAFWIDFQDTESYLGKYAVNLIGRRTNTVKDSNIKAIFFRETPNVLFTNPYYEESYRNTNMSYERLNLSAGMANYFVMSSQGKSAEEAMNEKIYTHTYYQESITVSVVPIYYLEPNRRIRVFDASSGINGEYIIKSFSLQLSHDGLMSINATKAEENIL